MSEYLEQAVEAAKQAGELLAGRFGDHGAVTERLTHDIKLAIDVESQTLITEVLLGRFPDHAMLGEEGTAGDPASEYTWVVDPIDGTVNYYYGIPHFCVSIALRHAERYLIGVVYDPMVQELWTVSENEEPRLNGRPIAVSARAELSEAIISMGFAKRSGAVEQSFPRYQAVAPTVRKMRMLGSAALAMAYVASGRLDGYVEEQVSRWDIAAGALLVERAGGKVVLTPHAGRSDRYSIVCTNGRIPLEELVRF